jgi:glycoprotein endo-alpha-1,2-mannosidase
MNDTLPVNSTQTADIQALKERATVRWNSLPRKVLAFYYTWYGNPDVSGRWVHWENVDTEKKQIASSTNYPTLGAYDSNDPAVVERHCRWAKEAGLDGFIATWWRPGDYHDKALPRLLDTAQKHGLEVTVYYELVPKPGDPQSAIDDWLYLLNKYGSHPAWLKVEGKPVLFVYSRAMGQLSMPQWAHVIQEVNRRYLKGVFTVADQLSRSAARIFDGTHTYNTCGSLEKQPVSRIEAIVNDLFTTPIEDCDQYRRVSCVTVIPGYDDTKIRKPGIDTERFNGESYKRQWEATLKLNPDWVLITSFNEWHEGSEMEPSIEHGDLYIRLTTGYAQRFKQLPRRENPIAAPPLTAITAEKINALRKQFEGKRIAMLPGAQSDVLYWLMEAGLETDFLTGEQCLDPEILTPKRYPVVIYAGGENYAQRIKAGNDFDDALLRYLRGGGCLLVMPAGPLPFYYNEQGPVDNASKFGVRVVGSAPDSKPGESGFEKPPSGIKLTFKVHNRHMPNLPSGLPFPESGDQRWRPLIARNLPAGNRYLPLIELYDERGRWWGDGAGFIQYETSEPKGGKVCYVWFRLLDIPQGSVVMHDVLSYLATQLTENRR